VKTLFLHSPYFSKSADKIIFMAKNLYVSPSGTNWKVHWEGESNGGIHTKKEDALIAARQMVADQKKGEVLSIRVQKADGTFQTEWTYGVDPYPPKG
jgi:hypothetical protein